MARYARYHVGTPFRIRADYVGIKLGIARAIITNGYMEPKGVEVGYG